MLNIATFKTHLSQQNNVPETFYTILSNIEDFALENFFSTSEQQKFLTSFVKRNRKTRKPTLNRTLENIYF